MKNFLGIVLTVMVFIAAPSFAETKVCKNEISVAVVDGMVCDFCTQSITKQLKKDANVKDVAVDLDKKTVTVSTKDGTKLSDDVFTKAVDYAGYKITKIDHSCKG